MFHSFRTAPTILVKLAGCIKGSVPDTMVKFEEVVTVAMYQAPVGVHEQGV
jgi:hypothetical protein